MQIRPSILTFPCFAAVWTALAGCATSNGQGVKALAAIEQRHEAEQLAFEREQRRLAGTDGVPGTLDFGALGQVEVESVELVGWPQSAILRADFTWINTGTGTRRAPIARLSILDEAGDDWRSNSVPLGATFGLNYGTGSTHSTWLRVHTDGLHLRPGWTWELELLDPSAQAGR